jgi:hypothetical protein
MTSQNVETTDTNAALGAQSAAVAPEKASSRKGASPKKGAPKAAKPTKTGKAKVAASSKPNKETAKKSAKSPKAEGTREGSKTAIILALLQRAKGATLAEIMEASSWQAHSCRGFISGTLGKKMGLTVKSEKREDDTRVYSITK